LRSGSTSGYAMLFNAIASVIDSSLGDRAASATATGCPSMSDIHALSGARIPRLPGRTLLHLEHAKVPQLDAMLFDQGLDDRLECGLNDLLGLQLGQLMLVGNRFVEIRFDLHLRVKRLQLLQAVYVLIGKL